jgi:hypothetical protein
MSRRRNPASSATAGARAAADSQASGGALAELAERRRAG